MDNRVFQNWRLPQSPQNALMQGLEMQRAQQGNALQQMQMQYLEQEKGLALQKAREELAQRQQRNALLQGLRPVAPIDANRVSGVTGPRPEALGVVGQRRKIDPAQALAAGLDQKTIEFLANADTLGMPEVARTVEGAGPDGRPVTQQRDKFGRLVGEAIPQAVKMQLENMGGQSVAVDPFALKPGQQFQRTMTPGERDSSARGWAGLAQSDRQFNQKREDDAAKPVGGNAKTGPMSVTLQKELLESDDAVQSAAAVVRSLKAAIQQNDQAYSGYLAKPRAVLRSNLPGQSQSADATIDIDNLMTGQGLESLKAIFGAAPTEGERKILMDMQASVDKTPAQRKAIMDRAVAAAERRSKYAADKAAAIRSGRYLTEGVPAQADAPAANAAKTVTRTGTQNGRKVVQYSDGSIEYAD